MGGCGEIHSEPGGSECEIAIYRLCTLVRGLVTYDTMHGCPATCEMFIAGWLGWGFYINNKHIKGVMEMSRRRVYVEERQTNEHNIQNIKDKQWLKVWYSINRYFDKKPTESALHESAEEFLSAIIQKFKVAQFENLLNKGISSIIIDDKDIDERPYLIGEETCFGNEEISHHNFKVSINETEDKYDYQFIISPKERYSLKEYFFDGYTLFKTNTEICKMFNAPTSDQTGRLCRMGYDEGGNPLETCVEGILYMQYLMKDRIESAIYDIDFDKLCFVESLFELITRLQTENIKNPNDYNSTWLEKVNNLIDEELRNQNKTSEDFEKQKRSIGKFLKVFFEKTN